jgi:riboflavin synthase
MTKLRVKTRVLKELIKNFETKSKSTGIRMFTGIIETIGKVKELKKEGTNVTFGVESPVSNELRVDQSVSHNGVCLTVIKVQDHQHWVTAIDETLKRSNLGDLVEGSELNIERCMSSNGRFDGHIVQGHVDTTATVKSIKEEEGSWLFDFEFGNTEEVLVEKGSVCINGVSLTCFNVSDNSFRVAIIPYTYEHTNFHDFKIGDRVNIEFDIVGKYVQRLLEKQGKI